MDVKDRVQPGTVELSFVLPVEVADYLKIHALRARRSPGELVADLVLEHLLEWEVIDTRLHMQAA
jgi:hypothetical protein